MSRRQRNRLSRRQQHDLNTGLGCLALLIAGVAILDPRAFVALVVVLVIAIFFAVLIPAWRRKQARLQTVQTEEERRELVGQWEAGEQERARQREAAEAAKRRRIEAMLHPDRVRDEIDYMSGPEFERFMADLLRQKGYEVEETPLSGDQGVDLILPDLDGKRVVIQLKRWTGPVGNKAIQATFAGMAHYQADEGWIISPPAPSPSPPASLPGVPACALLTGKNWPSGWRG